MEEVDFISNLPDVLLGAIVGFLPGMECVRTSILSPRWRNVWNYSSHLNFDQKQMLKCAIEAYIESSHPNTRLELAICRKLNEFPHRSTVDEIAQAEMLITSIIDGHSGPLKSCNIRHLPESCASGEAVGWMKKLLKKWVRNVSMERIKPKNWKANGFLWDDLKEYGRTLELPFEIFTNFEVLKLKNYHLVTSPFYDSPQVLKTLILNDVHIAPIVFHGILSHCLSLENLSLEKCGSFENQIKIESSSLKFLRIFKMILHKILLFAINIEVIEIDSISSDHQELAFEMPKLQVLRFYNDVHGERYIFPGREQYSRTKDIIAIFGGIPGFQSSNLAPMFEHLQTLCINFDLKVIKNVIALSSALKSCHHLQNLDIINQVNHDSSDDNDFLNDCLRYSSSLFWQRRELCECVNRQLKSLCIKNYTGKEMEMEFVKYIITSAGTIKRITLWFVDECLWIDATATLCLLTFPKASSKLSIDLKAGQKYMKEVCGSFENWVATLSD